MTKIADSLLKKLGLPGLLEKLTTGISPSDLNSLLLDVYRKTASQITAVDLLRNYNSNRFVAPNNNDPIEFREFELRLLKIAKERGYIPIELSPLAPLGSCSAMATVDQNKIISAVRGTEVVSDATNVMALESSKRRKQLKFDHTTIQFSTIHRHVRAQVFNTPGFHPHFKIFCLTTAGKDIGSFEFEKQSLWSHLTLYEKMLKDFLGLDNLFIRLKALNGSHENTLFNSVSDFIVNKFKNLRFQRVEANAGKEQYYKHLQFKIILVRDQKEFDIGDGGFVDWSQQLTGNKKERMLISGMGIEFLFNLLKQQH